MIKGDREYLNPIAKSHQCPEHGPKLSVAWLDDSYVLRCAGGDGHFPEEVTRTKTRTQQYKAGELPAVGKGLDLLPRSDLGTGELIAPDMIQAIIQYAGKYYLDPYRSHVMLMYGKPYISIDGYLFHAKRTGVSYQLSSRPLDNDERVMYKIGQDDHAWVAEVRIPSTGGFFAGIGIVTKDEMLAKSPRDKNKLRSPVVAAHPWQLAQKRAEWQAMRRAFPIGESEPGEEG